MSGDFYIEYDPDEDVWDILEPDAGKEQGMTFDVVIATSNYAECAIKIASLLNKYRDQW